MYLLSLIIMLGTVSPNHAAVLGDFEGGLDGWAPADATLSQSPTGATLGTQALQVDGPGGWHINALLDIKPHRESMGTPGGTITADVTAFDADMTTGWMQIELVINGQNNDDAGANNNIGWQSIDSQDVARDGQTQTFTWEIPESLISAIAGTDENIGWFELALVTNLDEASITKFYIDNIQLNSGDVQPPADTSKSTDTIIGNWEQDLDGWVVGGGADALFNDHNGVTLGNYSLDVYIPNGDWNQDVLTLDVIGNGLLDIFKINQEISVDVTRLVADWPTDQIPGWNGIHMVINAGGDGWSLWENMGYQAGWQQTNGDRTQTATWDYGQYFPDMDLDNVTWLELRIVSNANDPAYTGWVWFYLDNMKLFGGGASLDPQPASGVADVPIDSTLSWAPGAFATSHHVYFGMNAARVRNADMDSDPEVTFAALDEASFDPNGMEFKTQYFWRVDEVNESNPDSPWKGLVWNFTTANFIVVDDFEYYNDINPSEPGSNRILDTWIDGYQIESNGALVGNDFPPYAEQTTVRNGVQSMPVYYDNTGAALQSEVHRVWDEPQDWTTNNFNALKLYTHGDPLNVAGELYVIIEDNAGVSAKVTNPDAAIFAAEEWKEWAIPLDEVAAAGVNPTAIAKLVIGIADKSGQVEANGKLYIDDVRVGFEPIGLVASYALENNVEDSSGNGHHGTLAGDPNFPVSYVNGPAGLGQAMLFDGTIGHQYVDMGTFNPSAATDQLSVALWAKWDGFSNAWQGLIGKRIGGWDRSEMMWQIEADQSTGLIKFQREGNDVTTDRVLLVGEWAHVAATFDGTTAKVYLNGEMVQEGNFSFGTDTEAPIQIGSSTSGGGNAFNGALDEIRIYDIVLSDAEILELAGK